MSYDNKNQTFHRDMVIAPAGLWPDRNIFVPTASQLFMAGAIHELDDGRRFRYCENGAVALTKALMTQQAAAIAGWQDELQTTGTAMAIGDKRVTVFVTTAPTANEWDNGYLVMLDGTGEKEMYLIKSHTVPASGGIVTIDIADTGGIRTASAVTSEITIVKNIYKDVIVHPVTTATGKATGVPLVAVPANYFFWSQVKGPCPMVVDSGDTIVIGAPVGVPATSGVAGACGARQSTRISWGTVLDIGEADGTALIDLNLE
jgi:hypothetical protein